MTEPLRRRLRAMGFSPDADVEILRDHRPFPLHVRVGSTEFMVRRSNAHLVVPAREVAQGGGGKIRDGVD